jgi:hypothetical protein
MLDAFKIVQNQGYRRHVTRLFAMETTNESNYLQFCILFVSMKSAGFSTGINRLQKMAVAI